MPKTKAEAKQAGTRGRAPGTKNKPIDLKKAEEKLDNITTQNLKRAKAHNEKLRELLATNEKQNTQLRQQNSKMEDIVKQVQEINEGLKDQPREVKEAVAKEINEKIFMPNQFTATFTAGIPAPPGRAKKQRKKSTKPPSEAQLASRRRLAAVSQRASEIKEKQGVDWDTARSMAWAEAKQGV
jgi:hypothetical protein